MLAGAYTVAAAIVTVALISVLFSNANFVSAIGAVTGGFANAISAAKH